MDEYIECKYCKRKQACTTFVHPISKEPLRGYDTERLKKHVEELTEKYGAPAGRRIPAVWARSERFAETAMRTQSGRSAPTTEGGSYSWQNEQPASASSKATTLVPANVSSGDQLVLTCADGRRVRVIVEEPNA